MSAVIGRIAFGVLLVGVAVVCLRAMSDVIGKQFTLTFLAVLLALWVRDWLRTLWPLL